MVFGATAFAETGVTQKESRKTESRMCLAVIGSSIPQPCERFAGPIPTTASPIDIYGKKPRRGH
jgi:hypothetical protein